MEKLIAFDLDGTLLNTIDDLAARLSNGSDKNGTAGFVG